MEAIAIRMVIHDTVAIAVAVAVAVAVGLRMGVVLLGGKKVAAQRVGQFEVGPISTGLPDDGRAARDNVPEHVISDRADLNPATAKVEGRGVGRGPFEIGHTQ